MTTSSLHTSSTAVSDAILLTFSGVLDSVSYLPVRDAIVKAALDNPSAVIADVTELEVPAESALAVFTSARWHVSRWPDVPVLLVCRNEDGRDALRRNGITRYVPVHPTVDESIGALSQYQRSSRHRIRAELPADASAAAVARDLVAERLTDWSLADLIPTAKVVVTAFVDNALRHSGGAPALRLESSGDEVTIAVEDHSRKPASFAEGPAGSQQLSSLKLVDVLCKAWGCSQIPTGKTVWGVIAPDKSL